MSETRFYISVLVMVAIFFVGISPACAFISGKSYIEICAPDGTLQSVEVDSSLDPFAAPAPDPQQHLEAMEKCPFCFAQTHQKYGISSDLIISFVSQPHYIVVGAGTSLPLSLSLNAYDSRGPPVFS